MKCKEEGCDGEIDEGKPIPVATGRKGCAILKDVSPCDKCGRLYFEDGCPAFNGEHEKAFLVDGKIVFRA